MQQEMRALGLTEYQSRVFVSLAELGNASAQEITAHTRLPANKVYETLEQLRRDGLIVSKPARPKRYAIGSLESLQHTAQERMQELLTAQETLTRLKTQTQTTMAGGTEELFWIIKGQRNIIAKLNEETPLLRKESLGLVRNLQSRPASIRLLKDAVARGVRVKLLCADTPLTRERLSQWKGTGVELRLYDEHDEPIGSRFSVLDGQTVRITIGAPEIDDPAEYVTLWCTSRSFARMMRTQFMTLWKRAHPATRRVKTKPL